MVDRRNPPISLTDAVARGAAAAGGVDTAWRQLLRAVQAGTVAVHCAVDGVPDTLFDRRWVKFLSEFGVADEPSTPAAGSNGSSTVEADRVLPLEVAGAMISTTGEEDQEPPSEAERAARAADRTVRRHRTTSAPRTAPEVGEWDRIARRFPGAVPAYDVLWFDREAAWRANREAAASAGDTVPIRVPVRVTEITVETAGLNALWPRRRGRSPAARAPGKVGDDFAKFAAAFLPGKPTRDEADAWAKDKDRNYSTVAIRQLWRALPSGKRGRKSKEEIRQD